MALQSEDECVAKDADAVIFDMVDRSMAEDCRIKCAISRQALHGLHLHMEPSREDMIRVFREHRSKIEEVVNKLIDAGRIDSDGVVKLFDHHF